MRVAGWWLPGAVMAMTLAAVVAVSLFWQPGAPAGEPEFSLAGQPAEVADIYQFVAEHSDHATHIPCYCGCVDLDHQHLLDCFVRRDGAWEAHASVCGVCRDEAVDMRGMLAQGMGMYDIRASIEERYGRLGRPTNTP